MLTIRRSFVPFALFSLPCLMLSPAPARAADAERSTLRASPPAHVSAPPTITDKARPPRVVAEKSSRTAEKSSRDAHAKVNINTADVKTLMTLTGVSRKVAEKIVEYRDNQGPFKKADELRKVEGVGSGVWEKNRDRVVTK